jgi:hypothetical protein
MPGTTTVAAHLLGLATIAVIAVADVAMTPGGPALEEGFRNPPATARPAVYYLLLNGYVNLDQVDRELEEFHKAGIRGLCIFDMGARGPAGTVPPAGPAFLSPESVKALAHILRTAKRLKMEVDLSVSSSWDMGGSWVEPRDASMALFQSELEVDGPRDFDGVLPFPELPEDTPKRGDGFPLYHHEVALLAVPGSERRTGYEFLFELPGSREHVVNRVVLHQALLDAAGPLPPVEFKLSVSSSAPQESAFREVARGTVQPREGPQEFRFREAKAKYLRLELGGKGPVQLAEAEVFTPSGANILLSHRAVRARDGARLLRFSSERNQIGPWSAANIHDGVRSGARGSWAAGGLPPLVIRDRGGVVDLRRHMDSSGRLRWKVPSGKWVIQRYICTNTGERLKVPSPNSDGLATDHLSASATKRYLREVVDRLRPAVGDFGRSALKDLYLASYEVRGRIWTPDFLEQFERRRGYDFTPYLPILSGSTVESEEITERARYDFEKTLGDLLVDAYYRAAREVAHAAGLGIESEAGGPGPPIHNVPVDALKALGAVDSVRGEFWPFRPEARALWVVKETASAAHIYGKKRVHMEAFTSFHHWQEAPQDLKPSADRAFAEGMNHVVWHTASHQPPESGKPGWVYGAGTHLTPNRIWWPMAKPFLDYLARSSFLLQQGTFVADVLYYYGDQGFNFVMPKEVNPDLGFGYDYDVTNAEVILNRLLVENGKWAIPDGPSYEILVLPERPDIDPAVLRRVGELVASGGTVVGRKPERATGLSGVPESDREVQRLAQTIWGDCDAIRVHERRYGSGRVICGYPLSEVMKRRGVGPDFSFQSGLPDTDLDFIHRRTPEAEVYFVRNKKRRAENVDAVFRVRGRQPEIWLPGEGAIRLHRLYAPVEGGVRVTLQFAPEEAYFVIFRKQDSGRGLASFKSPGKPEDVDWIPAAGSAPVVYAPGKYEWRTVGGESGLYTEPSLPAPIELPGPWEVSFEAGRGAPARLTFPSLISWTERFEEGVRYYSGVAEYRSTVSLPAEWPTNAVITLDLGRLWAVAQLRWNGKDAGIVWKEPFRADVTQFARPGKNELVVRIANTWANRIIGDALSPHGLRYTRTNITTSEGRPWKDVKLIPSGLFGPVRVRFGRRLPLGD